MDIQQIRELVDIARQNGVAELTVEEEGSRVTVRMSGGVSGEQLERGEQLREAQAPVCAPASTPEVQPAQAPETASASEPAPEPEPTSEPETNDAVESESEPEAVPATPVSESTSRFEIVTARSVGTYYEASSPSAKPFVRLGEQVEEGQTLCIVETVGRPSEIVAESVGIVREICLSDGDPVEYGTPLFRIEVTL